MSKILLAAVFAFEMAAFMPLKAEAQMMSTYQVVHHQRPLSQKLLAELDKKENVEKLDELGVSVTEARQRIAALSDEEIQQILQGQERHAGGDVIVISLTTILLIVIIVLLIDR
jgi:hypothetical protein